MHEEKSLFVDYSTVLETAIAAAFGQSSYSEADTGIMISRNFFDRKEEKWSSVPWTFYFQRRSPWLKGFNRYLVEAEQAGLRNEWLSRNK